ncbi:MAG: hypothetical protein K8J31_24635 [Anaerolineae bacterium]|nr:hypothetical protein [Anaerolineae bacterium]
MDLLVRIFGWPHELLHVLALRLIGRRPHAVAQTHVDIPDDLATGEYIFVAGLPALMFGLGAAICVQQLIHAPDVLRVILWLACAAFFALGGLSTLGDLMLIFARLVQARLPHDYE